MKEEFSYIQEPLFSFLQCSNNTLKSSITETTWGYFWLFFRKERREKLGSKILSDMSLINLYMPNLGQFLCCVTNLGGFICCLRLNQPLKSLCSPLPSTKRYKTEEKRMEPFLFQEACLPFTLDGKPGRSKKNCFARNIKMWSSKCHINIFMQDVSQWNLNFFLTLISRM